MAASKKPAFKRILLKLSGEALLGEKPFGIDRSFTDYLANEIKGVHALGTQVGAVVGGGNFFRGVSDAAAGMDRASADHMGMLATVINAIALQDALERAGVITRVLSAIEMREVAEPFIDREQTNPPAVRFGDVRPVQLVAAEAAHQEMAIIDERIFDARFGEILHEPWLPDALGEPETGGVHTKAPRQVLAHARDLLETVGLGQRGEYRLVKPGEQQLQLSIAHQPADHVEPGDVVFRQPFQQRAGHVERERKKPGSGRALDDGAIHVAHVIGHDVVEIPHRLMQVQAKHKPQWRLLQEGVGCSV